MTVADRELTAADLKVGDRFTMPDNGHGKTFTLTKPDWAVSDDQEMMTQLRGIERVVRALPKGLKFRVERYEKDAENVGLVFAVTPDGEDKIAELFWNGAEWMFIPMYPDGEIGPSSEMRHIDVDPARRMHLNAVAEENNKDRMARTEAVNEAFDAALATMRRQFRDESWELAVLGAKLQARRWFPKWRDL